MARDIREADKGYSRAVYQAMDENFADDRGNVDVEYLVDSVNLLLDNTQELYKEMFNMRRKAHSVAWDALWYLFQETAEWYEVKNVRVTSEMMKQWFKRHGLNYVDVLKPVVEKIEEEREEYKREQNEAVSRTRRSAKKIHEGKKFAALDRQAMKMYDARDYDGFNSFSDDDLAKLASMCFMTQDNPWGAAYDDEVFDAMAERPNYDEIMEKAKVYAGLGESKRRKTISGKGLKEETYPFEAKRDSSFPYFYVLKHGFGPGTLPRGVKVGRVEDYKGYIVVWLDRPLSSDELKQYDIPSETMLRKYLGNDLDYFRGLSGLPEGIQRKRNKKPVSERARRIRAKRSMKESAWTAPNGKKYGKQKRGRGDSRYLFTRRELKDMVDSGLAQEIRNAEEAWKMSKDVIGYSWNETNGYKSGILFTDKDGNLWVGNTGVAQMFL